MKYKSIAAGVVALVLSLAPVAYGQQVEKENTPLTKQGSAALLLSVSGLESFGLYGPSGDGTPDPQVIAGAGMKYFFGDRWAFKAAATFSTASSGPDSNRATTSAYGLGVGIEWHCHDLYSLSPYLGANLGFRTSSTPKTETVGKANGKGVNIQATGDNKTTNTGFGGAVVAGFDWFFLQSMALGSEYSFGFASTKATVTTNGTAVDQPSVFQLGLTGGANVHLIVYF